MPDDGLPNIEIVQSLDDWGFTQAKIIDDCGTTSAIIDNYDGVQLEDGQPYLLAVVAYDDWLNVDLIDVDQVSATPFKNTVGSGGTPDRVDSVNAYDHAEDDGTAIDIVWTVSNVDDFAYYIVWVADQPVSDLSGAWAAFGDDPDNCGCLKIDKQWIDEDKNPIELTVSTALYSPTTNLMDLTMSSPQLIKPDIELFVTVTVHDIKGNVHLTNLPEAAVTPINNVADTQPPARLVEMELRDRPNDDGTGLLFTFDLSDASDVGSYEIYAASNPFTSVVAGGGGPTTPIAILDRNPELPHLIEIVAGDMPVVTGLEVWATVVARDTAGNAYLDDLTVVLSQSVDDGFDGSGDYITPIEDLRAEWFDQDEILVSWSGVNNGEIRGYKIYISDENFDNIDSAIEIGEVLASTNYLIDQEVFSDLDNQTTWFVAVSPFDDYTTRSSVIALEVLPDDVTGVETPENSNENSDFSSLLTTTNLLAAGLLIVVLFLLVTIVRSRGNQRMRDKSWELQEATWGIQDDLGWDDAAPVSVAPQVAAPPQITPQVQDDIYSAAQRIDNSNPYQRDLYQQQQPVLQSQNSALLNELNNEQTPKPKIDTSFLDDLL
jgi:hypothetical protein